MIVHKCIQRSNAPFMDEDPFPKFSEITFQYQQFLPLKVNNLLDISINDHHSLKFNCAPNYEKILSDKHINIYVKRLSPSYTVFSQPLDFIYFIWCNFCNLQIATKYHNIFQVINKDTKTIYETCAQFIRKTPKQVND